MFRQSTGRNSAGERKTWQRSCEKQ